MGIADQRNRDRAGGVTVDAVRRLRSGQGQATTVGAERVGVLSRPRKRRCQIPRQSAVGSGLRTRRSSRLGGDGRGRRGGCRLARRRRRLWLGLRGARPHRDRIVKHRSRKELVGGRRGVGIECGSRRHFPIADHAERRRAEDEDQGGGTGQRHAAGTAQKGQSTATEWLLDEPPGDGSDGDGQKSEPDPNAEVVTVQRSIMSAIGT